MHGRLLYHPQFNFVKIQSEESLEDSSFDLFGVESAVDTLIHTQTKLRLRGSQVQLDKNAEPPWDPDPKIP